MAMHVLVIGQDPSPGPTAKASRIAISSVSVPRFHADAVVLEDALAT